MKCHEWFNIEYRIYDEWATKDEDGKIGRKQSIEGFASHSKGFWFYPIDNKGHLKIFNLALVGLAK